ncbi:histidine phosphatase family protein [Nocardia salmonicida]|uniref:histidine phosphatase family protein n=1 Tax=Nocardia salmonicida TaxID=53431 RepID=UPI0033DFEF49
MAIVLVFETHSITVDNERGIATGWLPGELSEQGRSLARDLGQRYQSTDLAEVFTSDLRRAVHTAEIAFAETNVPIRLDPRLRECNYGALNGMPVEDLAALRRQHIETPFPGGQSYREVIDQTRSFLHDLSVGGDNRTVLVIAHSANKWALDCLLNGMHLEDLVDAPFGWQAGWQYFVAADRVIDNA